MAFLILSRPLICVWIWAQVLISTEDWRLLMQQFFSLHTTTLGKGLDILAHMVLQELTVRDTTNYLKDSRSLFWIQSYLSPKLVAYQSHRCQSIMLFYLISTSAHWLDFLNKPSLYHLHLYVLKGYNYTSGDNMGTSYFVAENLFYPIVLLLSLHLL